MTTLQKTALITGANKGIGKETARRLAALGITVLIGARDADRGEAAAEELRAGGADVRFVPLDVTDESSVEAAAKHIEATFGRLDILVNNAAIAAAQQKPSETPAATVRQVYETNVFGVIAVTHAMLPLLRRSPAARIVNMSSELGSLTHLADPDSPWASYSSVLLPYCTSKTALNAITVLYADELRAEGILVNAVSPGYCATDLNRRSGTRTAEEGAAVAVDLATVGEDGPTGAFLTEDGPIPW
ncbi:NAD(P)-dependent dehydrogenase (short-subunit alcohol dehydrogenase family) [Kribbella voronezhensis]|uniref:NAD(P)-dependent dehydrogenase (Short-subunit alcohol dehydrogenase family) n=1 Tax=Kribbella voronezhensis TaxID=2512212 RepID=A0A4R7TE42_9ACTN|nr:SDR family oxidoreductase [Kribbella voronezhensis]TDU90404.1 NAD(P)-dependent dehydrogenase (short-subunit alcohol dehydrogenase family) [Kribbella voronezhensis]